MEKVVLDFARYLRAAGVRTGLSEPMECLAAIQVMGPGREQVFTAMAATLVKRQQDLSLLEKLFFLYFSALRGNDQTSDDHSNHPEMDGQVPAVLTHVVSGQGLAPAGSGTTADRMLAALLAGDTEAMLAMAAPVLEDVCPLIQVGMPPVRELVRQAQVTLGWLMVLHRLEAMHARGEMDEIPFRDCLERLETLKNTIRERIEAMLVSRFGKSALIEVLSQANLYRRDFHELDEETVPEVRRYVQRLAKQLASKPFRRLRAARHGRIDLRRTVRNSLRTGGVPLVPAFRDRVPVRPELVLLCDISDSVAMFSRFMLQLVYTIQGRYHRVRSFVFVDHLEEVSQWFRRLPLGQALDKVRWESRSSFSGLSDFGRVFADFRQRCLPLLNPGTTLIILGDARNNWRPPQEEALAEIAGRARQVIWLNPAPRSAWDTGDSLMRLYAPYCAAVRECRNLEQLAGISRDLFA